MSGVDDTGGAPEPTASNAAGSPRTARGGETVSESRLSVLEIAQHPTTVEYVKYVSAIYAIVGVSVGVVAILIGTFGDPIVFDQSIIDELASASSGDAAEFHQFISAMYSTAIGGFLLFAMIPLTVVMGIGVGGYVGARFADLRPAAVVSGVSSGIGTVVALAVGGFLISTQMSPPPDSLFSGGGFISGAQDLFFITILSGGPAYGFDLIFGNLLVTSVLVAIGAGVASAGTVYVIHNLEQPPDSFTEA